jgi:predicted Fe-S protein YdhL (DUF1289 family)
VALVKSSDISTPCKQLCRVENNRCKGCGRSVDDIRMWSLYSEVKRRKIMRELKIFK